jgi:putative transposase
VTTPVRQGLLAEGINVSMSTLCRWFDVPRSTAYYRSVKGAPKVRKELSEPIHALIEQEPSFGYRTVAYLLGFNKNTVRRIFQLMRWPCSTRAALSATGSASTTHDDRIRRWNTRSELSINLMT